MTAGKTEQKKATQPHSADVPAGFQVIHANKLEDLREVVVELIRGFPLAPLEDDVFLVHSNGIAQWLKLALAHDQDDAALPGLGIAAAMQFSLPSRFLWQAYRAVLGEDAVPEESPFDKRRLTWRLMRMLPAIIEDPVFAPLKRFMEGAQSERRRFQLSDRIADLFDQYQVYRADWLDDWAGGADVVRVKGAQVRAVPDEQLWQPALWRLLISDIEQSGANTSRAEVHTRFMAVSAGLTPQTRPKGIPRRVIVFGLSSLPQQTLEVLSRLGRCCQVVLCVHNPCEFHWADIIEDRELLKAERYRRAKRPGTPDVLDDSNLHLYAHPLLAAWGKQGRDYIRLLDEYDEPARYDNWLERVDLFREADGDRLLSAIQNDILKLRSASEASRAQTPQDAVDPSIVFHSTHSPQRETEVLHDRLLAMFSADPTLKPQDIIVMVPDINAYTPHVEAVFGALDRDDSRYIPYTISDQGQRHQRPALVALEALLSLPESRLAVSDVLDLLDVPLVRERFGLNEDDLPRLHEWISGANIRWGLDAGHRAALDLPDDLYRNSWLFGLRRMLLGYAVGDSDAWQGIEPYAEVGGLESRLAGQLDEFIQTLQKYWQLLSEPQSPDAWAGVLKDLIADLFAEPDGDDVLVFTRLEDGVEVWLDACREAGLDDALPLHVVRDVWLESLEQGGLSQRFLAGKVNFATLLPMRAIPFRCVCLLGMNDGDYPRTQPPMDFDLMAGDYRPGDRSRREDDRFLFLEALLSARDTLYISWVGRSINDNTECPPSVLISQLRDHVDAIRPPSDSADMSLSAALTIEHPLQPFSTAYFPSAGTPSSLYTYAKEWRAAYRGHDEKPESQHQLPALGAVPADIPSQPLTLATLVQLLRAPVDVFFQNRLGVYFDDHAIESNDDEPFVLDGLERWKLTNRLVQNVVRLHDEQTPLTEILQADAERSIARGELALSDGLAAFQIEQAVAPLPDLYTRYQQLTTQYPASEPLLPLRLSINAGDRTLMLEDWVRDLRCASGQRAFITLSSSNLVKDRKYRWQHLMRPWISHLAGNCVAGPVSTHVLSQAGDVAFSPMEPDDARTHLKALMQYWFDALSKPLPVAVRTAFAWLSAAEKGEEAATRSARSVYESQFKSSGEGDESPYLQRVFPDFDALWQEGEFAHHAEALYGPVRAYLQTGTNAGGSRSSGGKS
ncbi:MAG: exodeoxyribonuclease V subunit gamma [Alteromonadaceae bacterium]|nr:exodeoxyribonuclease V subunit gamma [Alteromonadaceae bacterium]MBH84064.1 exodeoxyribonuclease V subunit gamma [Alteromonadaceae bacterium]|tara:strand:+ start:2647 stop:6201 length:3555 start_codon:yes stop_codon:yes gene_type:complete